ncbi:alpha/beta hydrolase [Prosthecobacter vanneervenii]|uniref:Pimeloyl-ACP methyl ester carboxylesterase n=1 Tax=Prosthecobacter vanneervenii TaxID=48466 RepID=A0A7W8DJ02_9BACT|nr:alpha/beta hydrolase [Prosthecobacter vanneervenii]MBB5031577.1 pimeloyl-ACP methyl ester carboxylesterase [Prosthecobacter vanneervenii]
MDAPVIPVTDTVCVNGQKKEKKVATLGFVEFDDQGQLWRDNYKNKDPKDPGHSELAVVLKALRERVAKGPVQLVIFVHGWNNNAKSLDAGNLQSFQETLKSIAKVNPNPFGVFISWRGMAMSFPTLIDIYNREAAALKIGQLEAAAAIEALCTTAKTNEKSRVIAVGHSLGAVILLRSVAHTLATQIAQASVEGAAKQPRSHKRPSVSPSADTVVLVNAADTAVQASQLVRVMQDYKVRFERNGREAPLLVSFTSEGDWATGWLYSSVTWISRYLLGSFMTASSGATSSRTQASATVTSVGWHTAIHSHKLEKIPSMRPKPCPTNTTKVCDASLAQRAEQLMKENLQPAGPRDPDVTVWLDPKMNNGKGGSGVLEAYQLVRTPGARNQTPYWIFPVPKFVVYNHTDVWNPNFIGLVTAIHNASRDHAASGRKSDPKAPQPPSRQQPIMKGQLFALPPQ